MSYVIEKVFHSAWTILYFKYIYFVTTIMVTFIYK